MSSKFRTVVSDIENTSKALGKVEQEIVFLQDSIQNLIEEATDKGNTIENVRWKVKGANFIAICEKMNHELHYKKIENVKLEVKKINPSLSMEEENMAGYEKIKTKLLNERQRLQDEWSEYIRQTEKRQSTKKDLQTEILVLQNRNRAMLKKLEKQRQETETMQQTLLARLNQLDKTFVEINKN